MELWKSISSRHGFFITVAFYTTLLYMENFLGPVNLYIKLIAKCLPVLYLIYITFADIEHLNQLEEKNLVFFGLVFSVVGDAFIAMGNAMFIPGMASFLAAHIVYSVAFGFKRFGWIQLFIASFILVAIDTHLCYNGIPDVNRIEFFISILIYSPAITFMVWRALCRVEIKVIKEGNFNDLVLAIGALFFMMSDSLLGTERYRFAFDGISYCIILTYYMAQLLITIATITPRKEKSA